MKETKLDTNAQLGMAADFLKAAKSFVGELYLLL